MAKKKTTGSAKKKAVRKSTQKASPPKAAKKAKTTAKSAPKKSVKKKVATAKKSTAKKATAKKARTKKVTGKKAGAKRAVAKKKRAVAKKKRAAVRKTVAKKAAATRSGTKNAKKNSAAPKKVKTTKARVAQVADYGYEIYVEPKIPKTRLTAKQLKSFHALLLEKRRELLGDVRMLTRDALGKSRQESSGDLSNVPIHMADVGSDNWEQDFTIGLIANERQLVREIDDALKRIEDRTYGVCLGTHKPITVARLRAKPWAKYSIEYARELETRRA